MIGGKRFSCFFINQASGASFTTLLRRQALSSVLLISNVPVRRPCFFVLEGFTSAHRALILDHFFQDALRVGI